MNKYYLTSAIPYVNAAPHIGHAQEFVYADVIRRFQKIQKKDVYYLCGADENGLKIIRAAEEKGIDPLKFTDSNGRKFLDLAEKLQVEFNVWQRGSNPKHHLSSQLLWKKCAANGDIYKKNYSGLYCIGCETFYASEELDENGECFEHPGRKLEKVTEENYFFRLSKYQDFLTELITSDKLKITPDFRKKETLSFIKQGLDDFSISRSRARAKNWGVEVPGDPKQIIYVWFDALNIYQSGIGFGYDEKTYNKYWPANLHVIGKGILRFHAVYWPAILKSAGLSLPGALFIHGYLTVEGQKMSKTVGNVVDPMEIIKNYSSDSVRYYLLREIPSYNDGDYSERRFKEVYNADLANGLGNLIARVAKLCEKNKFAFKAKVSKDAGIYPEAAGFILEYRFNEALRIIWEKISEIDKHINQETPWKLQGNALDQALKYYVKEIITIACNLQPFLPQTSEKILKQFTAAAIPSEKSLFPRIT